MPYNIINAGVKNIQFYNNKKINKEIRVVKRAPIHLVYLIKLPSTILVKY